MFETDFFGAPFPPFARQLLHINGFITLVDDFQTKQRLEDIFKRQNSLQISVFIDHHCKVGCLAQQKREGAGQ